ncbi:MULTISPECIES: hypothetical protein [Pseudomonas]|uniref:Cap15 family cyclic dinucleotide receptor domain-containing protein n=1 Tax=Pseudomonas TaxID=286 RepID=UPI00032E1DF6|nr:hypothetical protein [Pseudomonas aeruginosa]EOQ80593.1 hypothetical protein K652_10211 [Pseudomonas aeruginosa VRFPA02]AON08485.1 hypothetical protein AM599_21665 [Pseudomonas aeruginosa]AON14264.1 hypothetical protein A6681_20545 [Pseudomonas aeruginosa]AON20466.1 hypothetical protein A7331_21690 [Pseudomonas aeruginosa]AON23215.1 hypothetical protein A6688_04665 [Pseudomonas aeruginosa]
MYAVFGLKNLVLGLLALIALIFFGFIWWLSPQDAIGLISLLWKVASITVTATFILGNIRPVFKHLWKLGELCSSSLFPDLSGSWKGYLRSNVSVHDAIQAAALSPDLKLNLNEPQDVDRIELERFEAELEIKATLSRITLTMVVQGRKRESRSYSLVCKPRVSIYDEPHRLTYVYRSQLTEPSADDESNHIGAAELEVLRQGNQIILSGFYWTARNWRNGRNTAGLMRFERA